MPRRHEDWLIQAKRDLKAAQDSLAAANYEWSAFQAVQAAEKAAKALLRYHHYEARGHSVVRLLRKAQEFTAVPEDDAGSPGAGPALCAEPLPEQFS